MSGLYIHIPWCIRKCPYCDFNSHEISQGFDEPAYVNRLLQELEQKLVTWMSPIETIYFGGGTPSLFQPQSFRRILEQLDLSTVSEVTMEVNPGTTEHTNLKEYRDAGITRISLGIQSFNDKHLQRLGRIHNSAEATKSLTNALATDFDVVNVDLMYGLPQQNIDEVLADLEVLEKFQPTHVSWYELTIEPNTRFAKYPPVLPSSNQQARMSELGCSYLADLGYKRYEVSAFAKSRKTCNHNKNYWTFGDYIGVGAGAHGKKTTSSGVLRTLNVRTPKSYLAGKPGNEFKVLPKDLPVEFMMNVLRLTDGVDEELFVERTGLPIETIQETVARLRSWELLQTNKLQLTNKGFSQLNGVIAEFLNGSRSVKNETALAVGDY
ncbi:MAG: radical SAM family heme chaperone HemW [Gammaproteobacteria bacterium]|nr:radical SAM family heme chaperone HemW [Gammaproteobacteria bacterium]